MRISISNFTTVVTIKIYHVSLPLVTTDSENTLSEFPYYDSETYATLIHGNGKECPFLTHYSIVTSWLDSKTHYRGRKQGEGE